jgi:hypothetical protein
LHAPEYGATCIVAAKGADDETVLGQRAEESFDHIEPRNRGRREVDAEAPVFDHPAGYPPMRSQRELRLNGGTAFFCVDGPALGVKRQGVINRIFRKLAIVSSVGSSTETKVSQAEKPCNPVLQSFPA